MLLISPWMNSSGKIFTNIDMISCFIHCDSGKEMLQTLETLLKIGFVFTTDRHKTIDDIKRHFFDYSRWRYIYIGHNLMNPFDDDFGPACKMIMNTSCSSGCWRTEKKVTLPEFLNDIFPTW